MVNTTLDSGGERTSMTSVMRLGPRSPGTLIGILVILAVAIALVLAVPVAFSWGNLSQVLRQSSFVGLMAIGITFVVISGRLDLSIGSLLSLSAIVSVDMANAFGPAAGIAAGVAVGVASGVVTGVLVGFLKLNSLVVTLGMLSLLQGLALVYTSGKNLLITDKTSGFAFLGRGYILGIPTPVLLLLVLAVLFAFILARSAFGRRVIAVGGGEEAARFSGIRPSRVIFSCYVLSGLMTGLAAVVFASRVMAARSDSGAGLELVVLSGAILGGISLAGGRGGVLRAIAGILVLALIQNILLIVGLPYYTQWLFIWAIIISAVWLDLAAKRKSLFV